MSWILSFRPGLANNLSWISAELCIPGHSVYMCVARRCQSGFSESHMCLALVNLRCKWKVFAWTGPICILPMLKLFGQLWGMQSTWSDHSLKLQLPGRSTVTCAFSARQPNHARAAFCLNTPRRIPSLRVVNCCKMSSTGKSSQSILSLPMSVGRFFSASIAPRWKCSSLLLTASLLWEINLSVSEALAGASNHNLCASRYVTSRA